MAVRGIRLANRTAALIPALLLAACATPSPAPIPAAKPDGGTVVVPAPPPEARGGLKPIPVRPLNIRANCHFKDEVGYAASTVLDISYSEVRAFAATVDVPKHGSCRFDLADFEQVRKEPHIELRARDGCKVLVWEQGEKVTVAFTECANRCTRGTFDYVWPILVDRPSGQCH